MLILVAISLVAITGILGVVLDGGLVLAERRRAQAAADSAALAGVIELAKGGSESTVKNTAWQYASYNRYTNDGVTNTVTVNVPPLSGPNAGKPGFVEVIPSRTMSKHFIGIVYPGARQVAARSVAEVAQDPTGAGLLVLQSSGTSFTLSGSANVRVNGGSVIVNSTGTPALSGSGSAQVTAAHIDIGGTYTLSSSAQLNGIVSTGVAPTPDPLSDLPAVDPNSLPLVSSSDIAVSGGSVTLMPGRYTGKISGSNSAVITLQPGVYHVTKDISLSGNASLNANGVMIYTQGHVTLSGTGAINISPPNSGTYNGISIFSDRSVSKNITLSGGSNMNVSGTIYGSNATTSLSGDGEIGAFSSQIITKKLSLSGNSIIDVNYYGGLWRTSAPRIVE